MTKQHAQQIHEFEQRTHNQELGYIFNSDSILVGFITDTSESWAALSLTGEHLSPELYPEPENDERYYEQAAQVEQLGYRVIDGEWWKSRVDENYSIKELS
jgi:hypothetical protein